MAAAADPCPRCGIPVRSPDARGRVLFPDDAHAVIEVIERRFNRARCQLCGAWVDLRAPVAFVHTLEPAVGLFRARWEDVRLGLPIDLVRRAEAKRGGVVPLATFHELYALMRRWLDAFLQERTRAMFARSPGRPGAQGLLPHEHPLVLLTFAAQLRGALPIVLGSSRSLTPEEQRGHFERIVRRAVLEMIDRLYDDSAGFEARLRAHLPPEVVSDALIDTLRAACEDAEARDPARRRERVHAAVCALAGRENPRAEAWAAYAARPEGSE